MKDYKKEQPEKYKSHIGKAGNAVRCPVCNGRRKVYLGFYDGNDDTYNATTTATEDCQSCYGTGYLII